MLTRVPYQQRPVRHEYRLTDKGRDFFTVLAAMIRWGDRWLADAGGPPIELHDRETGLPVDPQVVDARTGRPIDIRRIVATPGPGFPRTSPRGFGSRWSRWRRTPRLVGIPHPRNRGPFR